jgi:hypothetical protein
MNALALSLLLTALALPARAAVSTPQTLEALRGGAAIQDPAHFFDGAATVEVKTLEPVGYAPLPRIPAFDSGDGSVPSLTLAPLPQVPPEPAKTSPAQAAGVSGPVLVGGAGALLLAAGLLAGGALAGPLVIAGLALAALGVALYLSAR